MGWLIALAVILLLGFLPLGISVCYDAEGLLARALIGPAGLTVYPRPPKQEKPEKQQEKPPKKPTQKNAGGKQAEKKSGGKLTDFMPLVDTALKFLNGFRKKLRVKRLELKIVMAGGDPCDLAINYGRAWTAIGNLMPTLERWFVIKKRNVEVECDFTASETLVTARLDLSITLGRLLSLVAVYGFRAVKEFLNFKKKRKGGAVK